MPTKYPHSSHPSNLPDRTSAQLLTSPFHGRVKSRGQIQELRVLMSLHIPHGNTHCLNMQPPASEWRSAVFKAQSLGSSLIHTIPAPRQQLPCLEDTALLFTRYQWSPVCRGHSLIHRIPAPHQWLPCLEDTPLLFTRYQRSAVCRRHSLIHRIPAPHQWLPCLEDTALLFTRYQRSAVCRVHSLIHMIPAPHQRRPCVEDILSFTGY